MEISLPEFTDEDHHLITAFLARCGIEEQEGKLLSTEQTVSGSWMAPSAQWAMAYGLCAFLRPNLHLSNPGIMTSLFPSFWNMYNTLPHPELKRRTEQEPQDVKPVRRRVIAQGVYGELPPDTTPGDDF
jgi:3-phosphoshikimate 1-carboxyvinyltransferase